MRRQPKGASASRLYAWLYRASAPASNGTHSAHFRAPVVKWISQSRLGGIVGGFRYKSPDGSGIERTPILIGANPFEICARGEMDITTGFEPVVGGSNPSGRKPNIMTRIRMARVGLPVAVHVRSALDRESERAGIPPGANRTWRPLQNSLPSRKFRISKRKITEVTMFIRSISGGASAILSPYG